MSLELEKSLTEKMDGFKRITDPFGFQIEMTNGKW